MRAEEYIGLVGPARKVRASANGSVHFSSRDDEHYTPEPVLELVREMLGAIELDPCSPVDKSNPTGASRFYTLRDDGLKQRWASPAVFMNPPYSVVARWCGHLRREHAAGRTKEAIALVAARPDTEWFERLSDYAWCAVRGRLVFRGSDNGAPFPSALFYLGERVERFADIFRALGTIYRAP